jgi:hypothetical protein
MPPKTAEPVLLTNTTASDSEKRLKLEQVYENVNAELIVH